MLRLNVEGMRCGHCVQSVTKAVNSIDPGAEVRIDLASKTVETVGRLDRASVVGAIEAAGFRVTPAPVTSPPI